MVFYKFQSVVRIKGILLRVLAIPVHYSQIATDLPCDFNGKELCGSVEWYSLPVLATPSMTESTTFVLGPGSSTAAGGHN